MRSRLYARQLRGYTASAGSLVKSGHPTNVRTGAVVIDGDYKVEEPQSAGLSRIWLGLGLGSLILLVAMTSLVAFSLADTETSDSADPTNDSDPANPAAGASYIAPQDVNGSTVQVVGLDENDDVLCAGSGTIVTPSGQVLTSAQVVTMSEDCRFTSLAVAVSVEPESAPVLAYEAELLATDAVLDIAVVRMVNNIADGTPLTEKFSAPTLGNSDDVRERDEITLSGFSSTGDESLRTIDTWITGFAQRSGVPAAQLLQTNSKTIPGFAGATATDSSGRVIGVVGSSAIEEEPSCLDLPPAVGAEQSDQPGCQKPDDAVNVVRPINVALKIVEEAEGALPIQLESSDEGYDLSNLQFSNPRFSIGQTDNRPDEIVRTARSGVNQLCLFVDWVGMPAGASWDAIWYLDGRPRLDYSLRDEVWENEVEGENFWVCASDNNGLAAGTYEVGFFINDDNIFAEGFVLTDEPVDLHEVTWTNDVESDAEICSLAINPKGSGPVGLNELPASETIKPGESITVEIPESTIVAAADDCNGTRLAIQLEGLEVDGPKDYSIGT